MLPMLEDPEMLVDAMGAAVRSLALDAVGEMDARADDVRSNARNARATRDDDADLTMEARVEGGATEAGRVDYRGGDDDAVRRVRGTGGTVEVLYLAS